MMVLPFFSHENDVDEERGGMTQGSADRGAHIPYPRFFTPQYPISQIYKPQYPISQIFYPPISHIPESIDHIPDFARLECVCMHSFDIQLVRMDPILLDIFIIAVNYLYMGIWNCTLTMYTIQICTWGVSNTDIKLHQPPMEDN